MITVIIPAYNEQNRITKTISAIETYLLKSNKPFEILVVNDGSTDSTKQVVKTMENGHIRLLSYDKNRGMGGAVKYGVKRAAGDYIVFTDADLPYPPENIEKACSMLEQGYDLVMGIRQQSEKGEGYPWYRKVMSKAFNLIIKTVLHVKEKDTQCGFKALRYEPAQQIFKRLLLTGWGFDAELLFIANKQGYTVGRLSVELFHDNKGSKIRVLRDSAQMMKEIFQIRKNNQKGLYE